MPAALAPVTLPSGVTASPIQFGTAPTGLSPIVYSMAEVPPGMSFSPRLRQLAGRPRAAAAAKTYTMTATARDGAIATQAVSITVT